MTNNGLLKSLLASVDALGRAVSAHKYAPIAKGKPTHAQTGVMFMLVHVGPQSIKDMAARFSMTPSAATQLVNGLVKDGYLVRTENIWDRRKVGVDLTVKGKKYLMAKKKERNLAMAAVLAPLSRQELIQLDVILQKVVKQVQTLWTKKQDK
jgi:DNA-binding MarR family transcriptional regulator